MIAGKALGERYEGMNEGVRVGFIREEDALGGIQRIGGFYGGLMDR